MKTVIFWRHSAVFFCFGLAALLSSSANAVPTLDKVTKSGTITLGYRNVVPFSYEDADKQPIGYSIDICLKIVDALKRDLKRESLEVKFVPITAASRIPGLTMGEIDMDCGLTTNTPERRIHAAFSVPIFIAGVRFLVRKKDKFTGTQDLARQKIVATKGTRGEKIVIKLNKTRALNATLISTSRYAEAFSIFDSGKADAFITDDVILAGLRAASRNPKSYVLMPELLSVDPIGIMFRRDDAAFKKLVDTEVRRIISSGEIKTLYTQWFESPVPPNQLNLRLPMNDLFRESLDSPTDWLPSLPRRSF